MAAKWSTGVRNFINNFGSFKQAFTGGKMVIYQGTIPTSSDGIISGTPLVTATESSGAHTAEVRSRGTVTITVDGTVTGITVNSIQIMSGTVLAQGDTTSTAAAVAANINAHQTSSARYKAWNVANVLYIEAMPGTGTAPNGFVVASAGTATRTDANMGSGGAARAGVASVNGLTFGVSASGEITMAGSWTGLVGTTGTAQYFVLYGPQSDDTGAADASPYHCHRIIGTCGTTTSSDYKMASTSLTAGRTHPVESSAITLSES
jgi:hypothetical protein